MTTKPLTFGSLFAGIGGFDLGFERAGMVCKWQVEIDPYCQKVLAKHWPNVRRHDDVRTFPPVDGTDWNVDVICGGFPCQDISLSGRGAGLAGESSGLFFEAVRVARRLGVQVLVLENVAALLNRGLDAVLRTLAEIGYDAEWHCLPAAAFGAPHIRDRVFILADSASVRREKSGNGSRHDGQLTEARKRWMQQLNRDFRWISEPAVCRVDDGVPDGLDRLRCLGNAVVPQVAEWIGRRIVEAANATN
jgi:DNA (cytosine-5)-methyltransferase 1